MARKSLVVNFWATWCAPCVDEMPELSALQAGPLTPNGIQLGIGIDSADNIATFASKYKISYPLFAAGMNGPNCRDNSAIKAGGLPFTVLIGPDGAVRKTYLGRLKFDELRRDIATL